MLQFYWSSVGGFFYSLWIRQEIFEEHKLETDIEQSGIRKSGVRCAMCPFLWAAEDVEMVFHACPVCYSSSICRSGEYPLYNYSHTSCATLHPRLSRQYLVVTASQLIVLFGIYLKLPFQYILPIFTVYRITPISWGSWKTNVNGTSGLSEAPRSNKARNSLCKDSNKKTKCLRMVRRKTLLHRDEDCK